MKYKTRNPNIEIRNKFKTQMTKTLRLLFGVFEPWGFGFVSDFDIRISDFVFLQMYRRARRRGAAAAELAVLLPFVALMFVVAVDFCRLYYQTQTVQACAEAGACYAAGYSWPNQADAAAAGNPGLGQGYQPDSDQARIEAARGAAVAEGTTLKPPLQEADVQVAIANGRATVTVTYDCAMLTPVLGASRVQTITRAVTMTKIR
jgi:TadE-like protein